MLVFLGVVAQGQTNGDRPIKILYREKAAYTEEAVSHRVEGTVTLRVNFESAGNIGTIEYVRESSKKKKLTKYGLVDSAIEAAKKMRFEPEVKGGKPVTITKLVEFSFLLPPKARIFN